MSKRGWCYTLNNYTVEEHEKLQSLACKYHVIGEEEGESGTPHLQGFIYFASAKTFSAAKKVIGERAHIEEMKGTPTQAAEYCKKEGRFWEHGECPLEPTQKGKMEQDRWGVAYTEAKETGEVSDAQIALVHCRSIHFLYNQAQMKKPRVDTETKHLWYWGKSGTGKSRKAREDHPDAYLKMCNKWWDGYANEDVVLIEDFDRNHGVLCHHLKIWADRYPFLAEIKGAGTKIRPQLVIVTSNYHPRDIWTAEEDLGPMMRRFHCVEFVFAVGQSEADSEESDAEEEEPAAAGMPPAEEEEEVEFQPPPEWTEGQPMD